MAKDLLDIRLGTKIAEAEALGDADRVEALKAMRAENAKVQAAVVADAEATEEAVASTPVAKEAASTSTVKKAAKKSSKK